MKLKKVVNKSIRVKYHNQSILFCDSFEVKSHALIMIILKTYLLMKNSYISSIAIFSK